jgi:CheY-like chemotaxis protein
MGARVLLVEDDADASEALAGLLASKGLSILVADEGRKALELMAIWRPAVVVLDVHMPGMDGREFRRRQLDDPRVARIPVVVITGDPHARLKAERTLQKPFTPEELLGALSPFLPELTAVPG